MRLRDAWCSEPAAHTATSLVFHHTHRVPLYDPSEGSTPICHPPLAGLEFKKHETVELKTKQRDNSAQMMNSYQLVR